MQSVVPIVGVCGFAGEGKSSVARILEARFRLAIVKFAGPLKDMLRTLGLDESEIEGKNKLLPCEKLGGATPRHAMQTLGTEWGRRMIADSLWTRAWRARAIATPRGSVADDLRFLNEEAAVREIGGFVIRVVRPGFEHLRGEHISEREHLGIKQNWTIDNTGTLADLARDVVSVMAHFGFGERQGWAA